MPGLRRLAGRLFGNHAGGVAVEFAVAAPILLAAFGVMVDLGRAMYDDMSLSAAARTGVQYARSKPDDTAGIQAAALASGGLSSSATVAAQKFCECPSGASVACTGTCPDGPVATYVRVTVSQPFQAVMPVPVVANGSLLSGNAVLRVK
ncbi:TadE/TadG family type IV pilus assembly protein [Azospirillum sp. sgz302134]